MSKRSANLSNDRDSLTVFVAAHVPFDLYHLLVEEAEQEGASRREVLR